MKKVLTIKGIDTLKPQSSRQEIPDGLVPNLYLTVQPTGSKSWAFRPRVNGKAKKITLGTYPTLGLVSAREQARALASQIAAGVDPTAKPEAVPASRGDLPVEMLCRDYLLSPIVMESRQSTKVDKARCFGFRWDKGQLVYTRSKGNVVSQWESRATKSITGIDVIDLLDIICQRGSMIAANRTLAYLKALFEWAVSRRIIEASPCNKIKPPAKERKRRRVLRRAELKAVWEAITHIADDPGALYDPKRDALQMILLTGQRTSIVAKAKIRHFDLAEHVWLIPPDAEGNKGIPYFLPITKEMERVIINCPHKSGFLFSTTSGEKPLYIGNKLKLELDSLITEEMDPWRFHDLRRTMRTGLSSLAIPDGDLVRELVIGHKMKGMHDIYDQDQYLPQKRIALELWAERVRAIAESQDGNVIPLKTRTAASGTL